MVDAETGSRLFECEYSADPSLVCGVVVNELVGLFIVHELERIEVFNLDGKKVMSMAGKYESVVFGRDGRCVLLTSAVTRSLDVMDVEKLRIVTGFTFDTRPTCCTVASDGHTVIVGDSDGNVRFLDLVFE